MPNIVDLVKAIPFWRFVFLFVFAAIVISVLLVTVQSYMLHGELHKDLLFIGFVTSAIDAFIVVLFLAVVLDQSKKQDALLNDLLEQSLTQSEEKYRLAMEATQDGLWDWNIQTGDVYYSPSWVSILGGLEQKNHYDSWEERIHPDDKVPVLASLHEHLDGKSDKWRMEHRLRNSAREWVWVLGRGQVVERDEVGAPLRMVGTMTDISERKQDEVEKEQLQQELLQAQKMQSLGQLAGGIAHDFNNILSIILGHSELAKYYVDDDRKNKLIEHLDEVLKAGERGSKLVGQMLTFSRNQENDTSPLYLAPLIKEDIKMLRSTLPVSIQINTAIEDELPEVKLNPVMLNQVLMNLCVNARDAMDRRGELSVRLGMTRAVKTTCDVCHQQLEGDWVELSVSDTGIGISPDVKGHIFEPFYTTKEVGKGTGMGLSMIAGIMSSCSGHTVVDSELGSGTTFRLLFPPVLEDKNEDDSADQ